MIYQLTKWVIISLLIILMIHYLCTYSINIFTVPKVNYLRYIDHDENDDNNDVMFCP